MAKIIPLADELAAAASELDKLLTCIRPGTPWVSAYPRAVNLLRHAAERERNKGKPKQGRKRKVKAHVGRAGKSGDFFLADKTLDLGQEK